MSLSIFVLPVSFIAIYILFDLLIKNVDWRLNFLFSVIFANVYLVVITEILSLFEKLTQINVFILWTIPILILFVCLFLPDIRGKYQPIRISIRSWEWFEIFLLVFLVLILLIIGVTAIFAPPNTPDVLNYHMPRVMHWIQNQSVRHYPTGIEFQNSYPPGSEYQVLHLAILAGNDHFVNLASWFMLVVSAICISYLTSIFCANRRGQLLSVIFLVTLPGAILQGSSAKNDLHVAFWVLLSFTLMVKYFYSDGRPLDLVGLFTTIGLGFLTKMNTMVYLLPLVIWFSIMFIRRNGFSQAIRWGFIAIILFGVVNLGFLTRNLITYDSFIDTYQAGRLMVDRITIGGVFSNLIRNAAFHFQFPWAEIRQDLQLLIIKVHAKLSLDINDPLTTSEGYFSILGVNTHENFTGNTLHAMFLMILSGIYLNKLIGKKAPHKFWLPLIFSISGYVLFSIVMKWQIFGARYFLPVFFLALPIVAIVFSTIKSPLFGISLTVMLLFCSWPWLLAAEIRPIISQTPYSSYPSIFSEDRMFFLLGSDQRGFPGLYRLPELGEEKRCRSIGIYGGGGTTEYQIWAILGAPYEDVRLEWIVAGTPSTAYEDPDFRPCLIVCHTCPSDQTEIKGLERVVMGNTYSIYSNSLEHDP